MIGKHLQAQVATARVDRARQRGAGIGDAGQRLAVYRLQAVIHPQAEPFGGATGRHREHAQALARAIAGL